MIYWHAVLKPKIKMRDLKTWLGRRPKGSWEIEHEITNANGTEEERWVVMLFDEKVARLFKNRWKKDYEEFQEHDYN